MRNFRVSDESGHQEAIFSWCDYNRNRYPELELLYHVPNGGKRDAATARALKRQGVKAGISDLVLPVARSGYHGLYVELKAPGGKLEQSQIDFIQAVEAQGYFARVCVGWQAAVQTLSAYLDEAGQDEQPLKTKSTPHEGTYYLAFKDIQDDDEPAQGSGKKIKCNIDKYLKMAGITQRELAERAGVTETSMSRYISGSRIPKAPICIKIAEVLGCNAEDLYT